MSASRPGSLGLWNVLGSGTNTYCIAPSIWKQGDRMSWSTTCTVTADNAASNPVAITLVVLRLSADPRRPTITRLGGQR